MFSENTRVLKARKGSPEKKSVSPRWYQSVMIPVDDKWPYVFEVLEKVGYSLSFAIGKDRFVQAIAGSP
jgi:hypothetical protein